MSTKINNSHFGNTTKINNSHFSTTSCSSKNKKRQETAGFPSSRGIFYNLRTKFCTKPIKIQNEILFDIMGCFCVRPATPRQKKRTANNFQKRLRSVEPKLTKAFGAVDCDATIIMFLVLSITDRDRFPVFRATLV